VDFEPLLHPDGILLDDEVHVWQVDLVAWEKATGSLFELLDPGEQERAERFKFPAPHQYVSAEPLLRRLAHLSEDRAARSAQPRMGSQNSLRILTFASICHTRKG
jgi:hypothetical protein